MSASNFRSSLAEVLKHEGGFSNHPKDPGGATNYGVTQRVYSAYLKYQGRIVRSVKHIEADEVADIYNKQYWRLVRGDSLPTGLDYAVFDFAVNSGVSRAVRYLQRVVGVDDDGIIGLVTLTAVEKAAREDVEALIIKLCANRLAFMQSLNTFPTFGKGWTRRVMGYRIGYQSDDIGVIDYSINLARHEQSLLPKTPGIVPPAPEVVAKAEAPLEPETFVECKPVASIEELAELLANDNDSLAIKIANS